jgi:nicotinamidase-related amidase
MQYFDADRDEGEGRTAKELGVEQYFEEYFDQIDAVIPRIQQLLALFRWKRMEVIHIRVSELTEDSRDVGRKQLVRGFVVPAGSREADFLDDLQPLGDELIINKSSSGVFPVTNLDRLLRNLGITTLVFAGTSTNGCVESAVRDAVDLGYDVVIASDACAAGTLETHELALSYLEGALTHILSTDQLVSLIDPLEAASPGERSGLERVKPYLPKPPEDTESADRDPYDAILPPALQLLLVRDNTALVLVDAQRFTCDPALGLGALAAAKGLGACLSGYYKRVGDALPGMRRLLEACREQGILAIHMRTAGRLPNGRDLGRKLQAQGFAFGPSSPEAEFMPGLAPRAGEIVLNKPASGIFTGTGLDELLRNLAVENLILAGISYDGAVEGSIRSTSDRGYGLVVVPDACAAHHPGLQDFLWRVESGVIQVKPVGQIVAQIKSL